jgi:hypothetical protein
MSDVAQAQIDPYRAVAISIELVKMQAEAIVTLINAGFSHDLVVDAVTSGDLTKLTGETND